MPNYQKVLNERPLVFLFGGKVQASDLSTLRESTKTAIGVYPYVASMNGQELEGIDAVSRVIVGFEAPLSLYFVCCCSLLKTVPLLL